MNIDNTAEEVQKSPHHTSFKRAMWIVALAVVVGGVLYALYLTGVIKQDDSSALTDEEKAAIVEEYRENAPPPLSEEEKAAIVEEYRKSIAPASFPIPNLRR